MANKKLLGSATSELRLPTKTIKGEKKPKWQAKTGGKAKAKEVEGAEPVVAVTETPAPEVEQSQEPLETPSDEIATEPPPTLGSQQKRMTSRSTSAQPPTPNPHQRNPRNSRSKPTSSPRSSA